MTRFTFFSILLFTLIATNTRADSPWVELKNGKEIKPRVLESYSRVFDFRGPIQNSVFEMNYLLPAKTAFVKPKDSDRKFKDAVTLYESGEIHQAFDRFQNLLPSLDVAMTTKFAVVTYLREILANHPHFKMRPDIIEYCLAKLPVTVVPVHRFFLVLLARGQVEPHHYPKYYYRNPEEVSAAQLIAALRYAQVHPDPDALPYLIEATDKAKSLPEAELFQPILDLAEITTARLYYQAHRYRDALAASQRIIKKHTLSAKAYEVQSWSELALKNDGKSYEDALAMRTAGLKEYFAPGSALIPAMVLVEACDYDQAAPHVDYFKKEYSEAESYLAQPNADLYADLLKTLGGVPVAPGKILADWKSSPLLISLLDENNLIVDEKKTPALEQIEKSNLEAIRTILSQRTNVLKALLAIAKRNSSLVDHDIKLTRSNEIVSETSRSPASVLSSSESVAAKPRWNWEKKNVNHLGNEEVWSDEVEAVHTEIVNKCEEND